MLLKYFYDPALAHASYMIGCQRSGEALIIDPGRDVEPYLKAAASEGMRIVGAAETHIHADFVSGSRELADRTGAKLYLSDEGPMDWKYQFTGLHATRLLKDGDTLYVGRIKLQVLHTPGHTPEHISFMLTDEGGGANEPMGIFTGDFVFVGSIGRPDLLETAAGVTGSAQQGARQLFRSIQRFRDLPDHLQVWPAHGAGSACGKGLGAVPSSTVGYEKRFNPALRFTSEQSFVDYILADQPETPFYFAVMKRVNKEGPRLIRELPPVSELQPDRLTDTVSRYQTIDVSPASQYAEAHAPGSFNIPQNVLAQWAGFLVNYEQPLYVITSQQNLPDTLRRLRSIGIDQVAGWFDSADLAAAGMMSQSYPSASPEELRRVITEGKAQLLDVRAATEFEQGHIPGAQSSFLGLLPRKLDRIDREKPVILQCQGGGRSAIASSLLQRAGYVVTNMTGGYRAWSAAGLPVTRTKTSSA